MGPAVEVYLELGPKKTFACAVEWPGWCRVAKGEDAALEATSYAARYDEVVVAAGHTLPARLEPMVVERLPGSSGTDFGVPYSVAECDSRPMTEAIARRTADIVAASWAFLDEVARGAPAELRKGPRGGGRDRDQIAAHVVEAEVSYVGKLGITGRRAATSDPAARAQMRAVVLDIVGSKTDGRPVTASGWPTRYAARRIAWHVLDHAWEIQDKS